jgi:hypothetical protein
MGKVRTPALRSSRSRFNPIGTANRKANTSFARSCRISDQERVKMIMLRRRRLRPLQDEPGPGHKQAGGGHVKV